MDRIVAYLGPDMSLSHQAALRIFPDAKHEPELTLSELFRAARRDDVYAAVVPIDNAGAGPVTEVYQRLATARGLRIIDEYHLPMSYSLLVRDPSVERADIEVVLTDDVAWIGCQEYVLRRLPQVKWGECPTTAWAAAQMESWDPSLGIPAVIGSRDLAEYYGLHRVEDGIETDSSEHARFVVLGKRMRRPRGRVRGTLSFMLNDRPGHLLKAMEHFVGWDIIDVTITPVAGSRAVPRPKWITVDVSVDGDNAEAPDSVNAFKLLCAALSASPYTANGNVRLVGMYPDRRPFEANDWESVLNGPVDPDGVLPSLQQFLNREEGLELEFKSTLRTPWGEPRPGREPAKPRELEQAVLKAVVGLLNTKGGYLIIGVDDAHRIVGLQPDFDSLKGIGGNWDAFERQLTTVLDPLCGWAVNENLIVIHKVMAHDLPVCIVEVGFNGIRPVIMRDADREELRVRRGPRTIRVELSDALGYVARRWPRFVSSLQQVDGASDLGSSQSDGWTKGLRAAPGDQAWDEPDGPEFGFS